jgi:hypothetical protein
MTRRARTFVAVAGILVGLSVLFPLWRIDLIAPQYPEGLGLYISSRSIEGIKPNDLASINGLNHYIGMRTIEPDQIPELRFMAPLMLGLGLAGVGVAALGKRAVLTAWLVAMGLLLAGGLADMYKWGYDYGRNLDPNAIIKVPGMTYQPPLIGSKQLLNFRATSWPAFGGWLLAIASVLAVMAWWEGRAKRATAAPGAVA